MMSIDHCKVVLLVFLYQFAEFDIAGHNVLSVCSDMFRISSKFIQSFETFFEHYFQIIPFNRILSDSLSFLFVFWLSSFTHVLVGSLHSTMA